MNKSETIHQPIYDTHIIDDNNQLSFFTEPSLPYHGKGSQFISRARTNLHMSGCLPMGCLYRPYSITAELPYHDKWEKIYFAESDLLLSVGSKIYLELPLITLLTNPPFEFLKGLEIPGFQNFRVVVSFANDMEYISAKKFYLQIKLNGYLTRNVM